MTTLHGSTASVSADSTASGGNASAAYHRHHRSSSSASVTTAKRSSSGAGARNSMLPMKAQTPTDTSLIALRLGRDSVSHDHSRRKSVAVDPTERPGGDNPAAYNRFSHSTSSSITSLGNANTRRSRASSGAVLPPPTSVNFSSPKKNWPPIDHSPRSNPPQERVRSRPSSRREQSYTASPERRRPSRPEITNSLTALPPLQPTPALTDPNDTESPSTIPTVATPHSSYGNDYFGDDGVSPRSNAKSKKSSMTRSHTNTMSGGGSARAIASETAYEPIAENRSSEMQEVGSGTSREVRSEESQDAFANRGSGGDEKRHRQTRSGGRSEKDKKQMLSRALQKANTAVLLDNAQNFEGALEAYGDACRLLQQVMDRSHGAEDRRKLDAIRVTYTNRMEELRQLEQAQPDAAEEKILPARPMSDESLTLSPTSPLSPTIDTNLKDSVVAESSTRGEGAPKISSPKKDHDSFLEETLHAVQEPSKEYEEPASSVQPEPIIEEEPAAQNQFDFGDSFSQSTFDGQTDEHENTENKEIEDLPSLKTNHVHLPVPENEYMPAPLSPRRPSSPKLTPQAEQTWETEPDQIQRSAIGASSGTENEGPPLTWLNTIEESSSSRGSSVHSTSSQQGMRRKHLRGTSDESNPDFDAAFDAAMETAYAQGLEPDSDAQRKVEPSPGHTRFNDSVAVRSSQIKEISPPVNSYQSNPAFPLSPEDLEEEELLDYITQDYAQGFNFDLSSKSALPRQSDSSGYSRSTWQSSQQSDRTTAGTSLSTVAEDAQPLPSSKNAFAASASLNTILAEQPPPPPPAVPPPQTSLPKLPTLTQNRATGVRGRRLSGQNPKQLKIQTTTEPETRKRASTIHHSASPYEEDHEKRSAFDKDFKFGSKLEPAVSNQQNDPLLRSPPSLDLRSAVSDTSRPMTATTMTTDHRQSLDDDPSELTIHRPPIKKNKSSVSLREHMVLLASPTVENGPSVMTPMSSTFMTFAAKQRQNEAPLNTQRANLPTLGPMASDSLYSGGVYLFDTSLSSNPHPTSPRSPPPHTGQSIALEPCPDSFLLRPFWLMRTIASTLTYPKGGFLTTRLFVPREVWLTRGVKLKSVEDKIANCDLLTAALGRLAGVDTYDADAVMEELQNFEEVMERVQASLVKRLGSDVGISGLAGIFKDAATGNMGASGTAGTDTTTGAEKTRSKESKGYLSSWRKLRNKSSGTPIQSGQGAKAANKAEEKELPTMDSVPMTSYVPVERRGHKKDARNLVFEGPNREYMGSLARLFEGVQVLDQIARQVVDPGLKGTSQTHVGLELSIRHAAEFFCFYVCRFVLADLGTLLDKFVKRGTEWVLA